jgi:hypothetical protein
MGGKERKKKNGDVIVPELGAGPYWYVDPRAAASPTPVPSIGFRTNPQQVSDVNEALRMMALGEQQTEQDRPEGYENMSEESRKYFEAIQRALMMVQPQQNGSLSF